MVSGNFVKHLDGLVECSFYQYIHEFMFLPCRQKFCGNPFLLLPIVNSGSSLFSCLLFWFFFIHFPLPLSLRCSHVLFVCMKSHWLDDNHEAVGGTVSSADHTSDRCNLLPFPYVREVEEYRGSLHGSAFYRMSFARDVRGTRDASPGRLPGYSVAPSVTRW